VGAGVPEALLAQGHRKGDPRPRGGRQPGAEGMRGTPGRGAAGRRGEGGTALGPAQWDTGPLTGINGVVGKFAKESREASQLQGGNILAHVCESLYGRVRKMTDCVLR